MVEEDTTIPKKALVADPDLRKYMKKNFNPDKKE